LDLTHKMLTTRLFCPKQAMRMVSEGTPGFREYDGFEWGRASQGTCNTNGGAGFSIRARNTPW
jgi:hypothetical protein